MKVPNQRKRTRQLGGTGLAHVLYHHKNRPTRIEVLCPQCGGLAVASEPCEHPCTIHDDLAPQWMQGGVFELTCMQCVYRARNVKYADLTEPFHQIRVGRITLWAWNRSHLLTMRRYLAKEPYKGQPYYGLVVYVRQPWLRRRGLFVKAIDAYLAGLRRRCRAQSIRVACIWPRRAIPEIRSLPFRTTRPTGGSSDRSLSHLAAIVRR